MNHHNSDKKPIDPIKRPRQRSGGRQKKQLNLSEQGSISQLAQLYLNQLAYKNYSNNTIEARRKFLLFFIEWCELRELHNPQHITKRHIESYQQHLFKYRKANDEPLAIETQRTRIGTIKDYFSWLVRSDYLPANPASEIELPKQPRRLPQQPFTLEQIKLLFSCVSLLSSHPHEIIRNRTILELFYATGIRRAELAALQITDIDYARKTLLVRQGKGKKDRIVPLLARTLNHLESYLKQARSSFILHPQEQTLFIGNNGRAYHLEALSKLVRDCKKLAQIEKKGSCHLLRHSCATHMLEGGADIRYIQQLLGHEKLETTAIYTQVSITKLQEAHESSHPLAKE